MVTYDYYIMNEGARIIANQGYSGNMYLSYVTWDRKPIQGNFGTINSKGEFSPRNLKKLCEQLTSKSVFIEPLAQATLELARKPVDNLI